MLPSFRPSLVVLVVSAVAVSADPGLTLKSSTPNVNVDGLENLKVTTTVTNTGDGTLKLFNDPRGVLHPFPENSFTITNPFGSGPLFAGAKVKYSPAHAAGLNDSSVFTVLAPGASVNVTHDLSTAYNFTKSGSGDYSIEPSNLFTYLDADGTPKNLYATVDDVAEVKLSGNLAVTRVLDKRTRYMECTAPRGPKIDAAVAAAEDYAELSYSHLRGISTPTTRYQTWFGNYTDSRKSTVENHFRLMDSYKFSTFTYNCYCAIPGAYAWVYPDTPGKITLCDAFWVAPDTGHDSAAGTLIHMSSHFIVNGGTKDWAFGPYTCKKLAVEYPDRAIDNADSHEYFAENTPNQ